MTLKARIAAAKKAEAYDAWVRRKDGADVNFIKRIPGKNPQVEYMIWAGGRAVYHEISLAHFARDFEPNRQQE